MRTSAPLPTKEALKTPKFVTLRTITALILREMGATYGKSPGGYIWAILEPVGAILIMSVAFSLMIRSPALGTSFILFYSTGYLPFTLYMSLSGKTANALRYSKSLLAYPRVLWIDAFIARAVLNLITSMMVFCIVTGSVFAAVDTQAILDIVKIVEGIGIMVVTALGVGLANALLFGLFPIWSQIWTIVSRPLFLASGVLFLYDSLPPIAQTILWWNPLMHGIGEVRSGFYPTYEAEYVYKPYAYGVGLVLIAISLVFLRKYHIDTIDD